MLDGSGERDSGSSKAILFVLYRCPSPAPTKETTSCLWATTAIRAVAPAADEVVAISQTTKPSSLETMLQKLRVYCRAITHYEELRRRSLVEVSITLLKIVEKYYDILNGRQEVSGVSGYFP